MTQHEYEQRKIRLQEELRAGVELLEAAYHHQLRALEVVWIAVGGEPAEGPRDLEAPASPAEPPPPPSAPRHRAGALLEAVRAVLAGLPDPFDRNDVAAALGYEPDRSSLFRVLQELERRGELALESRGAGKYPTLYRNPGSSGSAPGA
ncbi:MAG TPA: hypothetical protein VF173_21360 [Thermoanaerobaculia bacterium]|nr:hypothetical protein [Thermoanaerobaculia bacterium]